MRTVTERRARGGIVKYFVGEVPGPSGGMDESGFVAACVTYRYTAHVCSVHGERDCAHVIAVERYCSERDRPGRRAETMDFEANTNE